MNTGSGGIARIGVHTIRGGVHTIRGGVPRAFGGHTIITQLPPQIKDLLSGVRPGRDPTGIGILSHTTGRPAFPYSSPLW